MLQGPQLALRWRMFEVLEVNLNSVLVLNFPPHGQHFRFPVASTKQPGCHSDGYMTGSWHIWVGGDVPAVFSLTTHGGDGLAIELGEVCVALADVAEPFLKFGHSKSNFSV